LVLLGLPLVLPSQSLADQLQENALFCADDYSHVREKHNNNRSPEIDTWLKYIGLPVGQPYCAAFTISMYACGNYFESSPLPKIGRVSALYKTAQKNPYKYKVIPAVRVKQKIEKLNPGDVSCWAHGTASGNFNGHAGLVINQVDYQTFKTIEANTGSGNAGSQREGNGVYYRTRKLDMEKVFKVVGFIRVR
jgi:hypothetical protein